MPTKDSVGDEPLVTPGSTLAMTIRRIREMCHQRALHERAEAFARSVITELYGEQVEDAGEAELKDGDEEDMAYKKQRLFGPPHITTKEEQQMKKKKKSKPVRVWESTKPGDKPKHPGLQSMSQC